MPRQVPKQSDDKGTAFRIRPQTPKLNLLVKQKRPVLLESLPQTRVFQLQAELEVAASASEKLTKQRRKKEPEVVASEDDTMFQREPGMLTNFQERFEEILENEEVEDALELNERFLQQQLGVKSLSTLTKIEMRVDTSCHNLQTIGEILCSLEYLKMSDSLIKCFRDIGSSFKCVRVLHLARCELREVQGIQAFLQLEELYLGFNDIAELFDVGFLEHLAVLDLEGNAVRSLDQLFYLRRCQQLTDLNLRGNPVS